MLRSIIASVTRASAASPLQPRPEQHLVVGVGELLVDAVEDVGEERVADVGQHHADGVGLAAHAAGGGVRPVAQLGDRLAHLRLHRRAGPVGVAEHLRHGRRGDVGVPGDVDDGDPPGRRPDGLSIRLLRSGTLPRSRVLRCVIPDVVVAVG